MYFLYCPVCRVAHHTSFLFDDPSLSGSSMVKQIAALYLLSQTEKRCILEKEVKIEVFKNESKDIEVSGITVGCYFLSQEEELSIIEQIEGFDWKQSQSGRLKQDFGPKPNFKKKKLRLETFTGLPAFSQGILRRLRDMPGNELSDFEAVEQCHLDYNVSRGSHIDMHFDDFWLWGDRLVTLNLLSHSIISLTHPQLPYTILIGQPRLSVVVLSKEARNEWFHGIYPNHIIDRRVAITYRELTDEMKSTDVGLKVTKIASNFTAVQTSS
ncbi:alpha-ketoglutarate-dependent dioxygenase alkB homolog 4-like isoform X2 [Symsagittifera roscoffensis]|uniref:alpha-ketoglutarate-dependent dioxygenase alkB homolog 4-like isoform X2 n=1 Tax=Symsagittifera roscoffensis TaxID=84072 RepID=UPI00307BF140